MSDSPVRRMLHPKYHGIILLTLLLVVGEWRYGILGGYSRLLTTLAACTGTEFVFSWLVRGKGANIRSAYMSGLSMALLTKPLPGLLWPFAFGGFLAIASKYVITYKNRHIWNPTNLAICLLLLLAPDTVAVLSQQWGNEFATNAVIWAVGLLIALRAGVLHITITYVICFILFAALRVGIFGGTLLPEIAPVTGPMYQLFVFLMVTDPRTIVPRKWPQIWVTVIIAVVEALIRVAGDHSVPYLTPLYAGPPLFALTIVGPIAMFLYLRKLKPREPAVPAVAVAAATA
ncbi:MAG: hypothetical protein IT356_03905 [Gemmatimonadaceae bacterium]|nr:hypothetical protein [Gemmatimonadaceae bacterium]